MTTSRTFGNGANSALRAPTITSISPRAAACQLSKRSRSESPECSTATRSPKTLSKRRAVCGVSEISGTSTIARPPRAIVSAIARMYTNVFPLPVTPCTSASANSARSTRRAIASIACRCSAVATNAWSSRPATPRTRSARSAVSRSAPSRTARPTIACEKPARIASRRRTPPRSAANATSARRRGPRTSRPVAVKNFSRASITRGATNVRRRSIAPPRVSAAIAASSVRRSPDRRASGCRSTASSANPSAKSFARRRAKRGGTVGKRARSSGAIVTKRSTTRGMAAAKTIGPSASPSEQQ